MEESKRGRPKKFVDRDLVRKLAQIQCTHAEIAATLDLSVDTLTRNEDFAEVYRTCLFSVTLEPMNTLDQRFCGTY